MAKKEEKLPALLTLLKDLTLPGMYDFFCKVLLVSKKDQDVILSVTDGTVESISIRVMNTGKMLFEVGHFFKLFGVQASTMNYKTTLKYDLNMKLGQAYPIPASYKKAKQIDRRLAGCEVQTNPIQTNPVLEKNVGFLEFLYRTHYNAEQVEQIMLDAHGVTPNKLNKRFIRAWQPDA